MILIADAGSTKTDWRIVENPSKILTIKTIGFNPVLTSTELIINELQKSFSNSAINHKFKIVYYYGAGCWSKEACLVVEKALALLFPNAQLAVNNDLLGAARALCGKKAGVACILGTGANSCLFDGQKIIDNVPPLGYIMGDEGSGAYLGKMLLQSYFYRELPTDLKTKLEKEYLVSKQNLLANVYQKKDGNKYLASFAKFLIKEKQHPFVKKLIKAAFHQFIERQVLKYQNYKELPVHFVGSIAYFLKDILKEVLIKNQLTLGKIIRQPIDGLVDYHKRNDEL